MHVITQLGSPLFLIIITILAYLYIDKKAAANLFFAYAIALVVIVGIRSLYFKERPNKKKYHNIFQKLTYSSFPSAHAAKSVIMAYFFSITFPNIYIILLVWALAFLVSYSRIYLKYHFVIDVVVGALLGLAVSLILL